ncbi:unnamed protein product [Paramecium octaurelia]|uniref:Transmembrane protein n=1 Tax=Paramecium octaurelia TaxID=43137 RepID=A0A8S1Y3Y9_PAROT|nr:unnamed protein product [Paramecium octaurelia]
MQKRKLILVLIQTDIAVILTGFYSLGQGTFLLSVQIGETIQHYFFGPRILEQELLKEMLCLQVGNQNFFSVFKIFQNQLFKNVEQTNTENDAKLNRKIQSNPQINNYQYEIIDLLIPAQFFDSQIQEQKAKLDCHSDYVTSICYSLMEIHQLLVVMITLSVFGIQKHRKGNTQILIAKCQS